MIKTTIICDRCGVEWEQHDSAHIYDWHWSRGAAQRYLHFCPDCSKLYGEFLHDLQEMEEAMIQQFLSLEPELVSSPED